MHGYAHNRACQLDHHPKYTAGSGTEDFEGCERFFSISNGCAPTTRYTTPFHRHQLLDSHFHDHDEGRDLALGRLLYMDYKDALERLVRLSETFTDIGLEASVRGRLYEEYLHAEASHLASLKTEPLEDQSRYRYVESLEKLWAASAQWEDAATKAGMIPGSVANANTPFPPHLRKALSAYNVAMAETLHFERILGIEARWERGSVEYKEARKDSDERTYNLALTRLERLVVQRLFELQKAHLIGTCE
jgi:hypothetical protein